MGRLRTAATECLRHTLAEAAWPGPLLQSKPASGTDEGDQWHPAGATTALVATATALCLLQV
jgi:hypothetical protein